MSETHLMNDAAARSPTGEILDQVTTQPTTETKAPDTTALTQTEVTKPAATTETTEGTTLLTKPADAKPADPAAKPAAPEKYADFKAPDGFTLAATTIEAATPIFKELGLTQDQAQKLVDFHAAQMIEASKAPEAAMNTMRQDWVAKVQADPELKAAVNGDKVGLDAVKADIGRALSALGDAKLASEFKSAMDLTGAGDHPAFVKAFWKLSQFVAEGKHVAGDGPSIAGQRAPGTADKPSAARALYPNNP